MTRLQFDGLRCVGVAYRLEGLEHVAHAAREVILCSGSVGSPHLLHLSGIGPSDHLGKVGIGVVQNLPGVGSNLRDHFVARISNRVIGAITLNEMSRGYRLTREMLRWLLCGSGVLTCGIMSAVLFCRSREGLASPDLQLLFTPGSYNPDRTSELEDKPGMTIVVCAARAQSQGTIMVRSPDPFAAPAIWPNYLSAAEDERALVVGLQIARTIFAQPALARYCSHETIPGRQLALSHYVKTTGRNFHHPVGTCRMGTDPLAVVDARLRVHGLGGLRVVDASVMPTLPTGNTNASTIMVAEKGAAMALEDWWFETHH